MRTARIPSFRGVKTVKDIKTFRRVKCPACNGAGIVETRLRCLFCGGSGFVRAI